ncbi:hypothetical protein ASD22_01670 [Rhodanobacter sp. Root480]|jgi:hypothetical protein|uniref:DUF3293 domain-containing protein n=1 Tax=Rhodanobacter sp. Root480 TaxID=1736542 RepID=UPI0006F49EAF|nr:DUF3293 domain-containing protein [Rhodanobacter sp. Root480]KQX99036.1 hypothetical protein ASD22_01670 [Rhodanobacter sp. Root480]
MDEILLEAFRSTAYHTCIDTVNWATVRVDLPLPGTLTNVVGMRSWAFITAWNPQARRRSPEENLAAQHALLDALQRQPDASVYPAIGVGTSGWIEPTLFVIGPDVTVLDRLAREHSQLAYVHGQTGSPAQLRLLE